MKNKEIFPIKKALKEADKLKKLVPPKSEGHHFHKASTYIDNIENAKSSRKKPSKNELENFVVTEEMWVNALNYFHEHRSELINKAMEIRDFAISHRNPPFQVGSVVMGIEPKASGNQYSIDSAYNFTLKPGSIEPNLGKDKRCAERGALEIALEYSRKIVAVVSVSREFDTGDGNESPHALHPCEECRKMFSDLKKKGIMQDDTIVCSVNDSDRDNLKVEELPLGSLLDLYKN